MMFGRTQFQALLHLVTLVSANPYPLFGQHHNHLYHGERFAVARASPSAFVPGVIPSTNRAMSVERLGTSQLHLFALNLFGDNDDKDNKKPLENSNDDDSTAVPSWVHAITQWPLYPTQPTTSATRGQLMTSTPSTLEEQKEALRQAAQAVPDKSSFFTSGLSLPVSFTNLINVEALLLMANRAAASQEEQQPLSMENVSAMLLDWSTNNISSITTEANTTDDSHADGHVMLAEPWSILPDIEELSGWTKLVQGLQRSLTTLPPLDTVSATNTTESNNVKADSRGVLAESILKEASNRIEFLVAEISAAFSPSAIQGLALWASQTLEKSPTARDSNISTITGTNESAVSTDFMEAIVSLAKRQGVDVLEATKLAGETTKFFSDLKALGKTVSESGFAVEDTEDQFHTTVSQPPIGEQIITSKPLFADFASARVLSSRHDAQMKKAAEMGALTGAIYQETLNRTRALGHSLVANGTAADVVWMVTDSIGTEADYREISGESKVDDASQQQVFVRTITVRGFDASDDAVDRERLLNVICTATPERIGEHVLVHAGLMSVARQVYQDIKKYIMWTAPNHRFVFTGHSIGGSLAILMLMLFTEEFGAEFVRNNVLRVFTFGSPPVTTTTYKHVKTPTLKNPDYLEVIERGGTYQCDVLKEFDLPPFLVYGFAQPWDPIVRLFSEIDALYPLLGDLGEDGVTLYASGPPRSLRPILRAVVESWEGWPFFRDNFRSSANQNYTSVGVQHILLPEAGRYLSDRWPGANVGVPPVNAVLRISSMELLPGLQQVFPLEVFHISFVPAAIRGFIHHFYPAYGDPFVEFVTKFDSNQMDDNTDSFLTFKNTTTNSSSIEVVTTSTEAKNDAFQEVPSRDERILLRNGANKKSRLVLGLGWTRIGKK